MALNHLRRLCHEQGRNAMRGDSIGLQVRCGARGARMPMSGGNDGPAWT